MTDKDRNDLLNQAEQANEGLGFMTVSASVVLALLETLDERDEEIAQLNMDLAQAHDALEEAHESGGEPEPFQRN